MKRVVLCGGIFLNRMVKKIIDQKFSDHFIVTHFCDPNENIQDSISKKKLISQNIRIISIAETSKLYFDKNIDLILITESIFDVKHIGDLLYQQLIEDIYYISDILLYKNINDISIDDIFIKFNAKTESLSTIAVDITEHCNLNCRGCSHCCDISNTKKFADLNTFIRDLDKIKELFVSVNGIYIMGGEPLLNHDFIEYIKVARKIFPYAAIIIVTNGLLINKLDSQILYTMKENNAKFRISNYRPTQKIRAQIEHFLNQYNMYYKFTKPITHFYKRLTLNPNNNKDLSHKNCKDKNCHIVKDGYIYKCPYTAYIDKINNYYKTNIEFKDGSYSLYNYNTGLQLFDSLSNSIEACSYCSVDPQYYDWELAQPDCGFTHFVQR